jgi:transposase-like protein
VCHLYHMKTTEEKDELNLITLAQQYSDDDKARELLESLLWPHGAYCPHCKADMPYKLTPKATSKRPARKGLYKCRTCRKQFTVTVGTIFEDSHIPIGKWLMAIFLLCSSKKGMSAHQIHRMLKITYKSAWFMMHRLRYAMDTKAPLGKLLQGVVECDETFIGGKPRIGDKFTGTGYRKDSNKTPVVALVERGGDVRTKVVASVNQKNLRSFLDDNIVRDCVVNTDQNNIYKSIVYPIVKGRFGKHEVVNHSRGEYARHNPDGTVAHINTCESFFSLLKRGMFGAFHHVSKEHLHRYCGEFSFRWNARFLTDGERMERAVALTEGKRLTYRQVN